jgi:hypothetical protein
MGATPTTLKISLRKSGVNESALPFLEFGKVAVWDGSRLICRRRQITGGGVTVSGLGSKKVLDLLQDCRFESL